MSVVRLRGWPQVLRAGLGVVTGGIFVYLFMRSVDLRDVGALLRGARWEPLVLALAAFVLDFLLRAVRFSALLNSVADRPVSLRASISPYIASFGVSDVLPFRVGDAFRVVWFARIFCLPAGTVIGAMIVERLLDLISIVFIGTVALQIIGPGSSNELASDLGFVLGVAFVGGLALLFAPRVLANVIEGAFGGREHPWINRITDFLRSISDAVRSVGSWRRVLGMSTVSALLWLLESMVLVGAWVSLGGAVSEWVKPLAAFAFATIGTLFPGLPGHFGTFEYFGMQALQLTNVPSEFAAAVILLAHLILWVPTALFGIVWLLLGGAGSKPKVRTFRKGP